MIKFLGRRLVYMLISLWVIVTATFFLMRSIPGGPFSGEKKLPPAIEASLNSYYGLDQPLFKQYLDYLVSVMKWDFGPSFKYKGQTVNELINSGFPISFTLGMEAICLALAFGVLFGVIAALKRNKWQDYTAMIIAVIGISVPNFIMAASAVCTGDEAWRVPCRTMGIMGPHRSAGDRRIFNADGVYRPADAFKHARST